MKKIIYIILAVVIALFVWTKFNKKNIAINNSQISDVRTDSSTESSQKATESLKNESGAENNTNECDISHAHDASEENCCDKIEKIYHDLKDDGAKESSNKIEDSVMPSSNPTATSNDISSSSDSENILDITKNIISNQLIENATAGDLDSILKLADLYAKNNDKESAMKWYKIAESKGADVKELINNIK